MAAVRRVPSYSLPGAHNRKRGRPFSLSLYGYLLFKQSLPFILILLGLLYYFNLFPVIHQPFSALKQRVFGISENHKASSEKSDPHDSARVKKLSSLSQIIERSDPRRTHKGGQLRSFEDHVPVYSYVHFSSYRTSSTGFVAIGLSGLALHDTHQLGRCQWKERNGGHRVSGKLQALYPGEHHNLRYEVILLLCNLGESTDKDTGGDLYMTIDGEEMLVYKEASGQFLLGDPSPPFKYQLSFCSPPLAGDLEPRRIYEWIEYHLQQGVDYMFVYDAGGVDLKMIKVLEPYLKLGLMEVVDLRKVVNYETWDNGHLLAINDCAYRSRYSSKWTAMFDFNEYFDFEGGKETLLSLVEKHVDKPYVTLGSRWWSIEKCLPEIEGSDWSIQRMLFHWPDVYCPDKTKFPKASMCLDYHGYRKYVVNPRKAGALQIHRSEVPRSGGVDVDASEARLNRWNDLVLKSDNVCKSTVKVEDVIDWWVRDLTIAHVAQDAQLKPRVKWSDIA